MAVHSWFRKPAEVPKNSNLTKSLIASIGIFNSDLSMLPGLTKTF